MRDTPEPLQDHPTIMIVIRFRSQQEEQTSRQVHPLLEDSLIKYH